MRKIFIIITFLLTLNSYSQTIKGVTYVSEYNVFCISFTDMYVTHITYDQKNNVSKSQLYKITKLSLSEVNNKITFDMEITSGYSGEVYNYILEMIDTTKDDKIAKETFESNLFIYDKETNVRLRYPGEVKPHITLKQF